MSVKFVDTANFNKTSALLHVLAMMYFSSLIMHYLVCFEKDNVKNEANNINIGNAYRRARNALCFEKPHCAVTVQLDKIKAKLVQKNQSIRPKLYH